MRLRLFLAAAIVPAIALGQVYKWTDPSGRVHYGDSAPDDAKPEQLKMQVRSYEGPAKVMDWAAVIRSRAPDEYAAAASGVVMYSTSWCPHCKRARRYFAKHGIAFQDIDVEKSEAGARAFAELGGGGVPLIIAGGKAMRGFDESGIAQLLGR